MALKIVPIALAVLHVVASLPVTLQDLEVADDTMAVGSYIREVRAVGPDDYHKSYESEGDGEIGYSRKKSGGGKKGYQHFDTFHKKAGDNYEFEKQDSYGLDDEGHGVAHGHDHYDDGGHHGAHSHRHEKKVAAKLRKPRHHEDDVEEVEPSYNKKGRPEVEHEDLKEGAPDGNGGTEAHGHNPNDYVLPEKYTYGEGDEYNF